jgi:putative transcriptional regulator
LSGHIPGVSKSSKSASLTGSLLVATPALTDPHFRRSIVFLSHHTPKEGATGFVLNRPLASTLSEIVTTEVGPFSEAPVYYGGPVAQDQIVAARLQWSETPPSVEFSTFGWPGQAPSDPTVPSAGTKLFIGHSGWTPGQLENEIAEKAWFVVAPSRELIEMPQPGAAWRNLLRRMDPALKLLAEAPDDPSLN